MRRLRKRSGVSILVISIGLAFVLSGCQTIKKATNKVKADLCRENLVRIAKAKKKWALANEKTSGPGPELSELIGTTPQLQSKPRCREARGQYSVNAIGTAPTCSIEGHILY